MSTFVTSKGTRTQHVFPKYESRPYRPSPARREAIFGRIQGIPDRRDPTAKWFIIGALLIAGFFALQLLRPLASARGNAASSAHPLAEGSTAVLLDAKDGKR